MENKKSLFRFFFLNLTDGNPQKYIFKLFFKLELYALKDLFPNLDVVLEIKY